jgi:DNA-binding MarR family transcriptional regulator
MQLDSRAVARQMATECVGRRIRHLSRVVSRHYDAALAPLGLTLTQLELLGIIELRSPLSPRELAGHVGADKSTMSRNLRVLAGNGWVTVEPDGRRKLLGLTGAGRDLLGRAGPSWRQAQDRVVAELGDGVVTALDGWIEAAGRSPAAD